MYALVAMGLALALLVGLLQLKVRLGRSMVASALVLAVLLKVGPGQLWHTIISEWHDKPLGQTTGYMFVALTALVTLVNVLGAAMKETGVSQRLAPALQGLFRSRRFALSAIPLVMGMLPTPGGIMLSAPMVRDLADHVGMGRARSAAINFLFRHQWESIWPLFPAVPLVQGMFGISAFSLISHNGALALAGILGGIVFLLLPAMPPKQRACRSRVSPTRNIRNFVHAFWPIAMVAAVYAGFDVPPALGLLLAILLFLSFHKVRLNRWGGIFRAGLEPDFALLIFGALLFKLNLQAGQAIPVVVQFFSEINMPKHLIIFLLPCLVGFLTGVTMPTVAITFPFLARYIGSGREANVELQTLAFAGLLCGLLTTPVHLCLALSASYFETPLARILARLVGPVAFIAAAGILMALFI
jgi:integral membrane protein (TIGR00529 family)